MGGGEKGGLAASFRRAFTYDICTRTGVGAALTELKLKHAKKTNIAKRENKPLMPALPTQFDFKFNISMIST